MGIMPNPVQQAARPHRYVFYVTKEPSSVANLGTGLKRCKTHLVTQVRFSASIRILVAVSFLSSCGQTLLFHLGFGCKELSSFVHSCVDERPELTECLEQLDLSFALFAQPVHVIFELTIQYGTCQQGQDDGSMRVGLTCSGVSMAAHSPVSSRSPSGSSAVRLAAISPSSRSSSSVTLLMSASFGAWI